MPPAASLCIDGALRVILSRFYQLELAPPPPELPPPEELEEELDEELDEEFDSARLRSLS
ncbi:hypothetical protein D3C83_29660 [compost metagenome]